MLMPPDPLGPPPPEQKDLFPHLLLLVALPLFVLILVIIHATGVVPRREAAFAPAADSAMHPDTALLDLGPDGGLPVPRSEPAPSQDNLKLWQARPPCKKGEHNINGACYMRWDGEDMLPPCLSGSVEFKGRCYRPIAKAERPDTSIHR